MDFLDLTERISIIVGILIAILLLLIYLIQNKILYIPEIQGLKKSPDYNPAGYRNPKEHDLPYENINIVTSDGVKLHGWICKQPASEKSPTIVYFHENAGNIGTRLEYIKTYYTKIKANIVLVAYRGYSNSEGTPSEKGLLLDAEAILKHVFERTDIDCHQIYLHGRSLGGAVTIYAASELKNRFAFKGLIIENTFTSIIDMASHLFSKYLVTLVRLVLVNRWPSKQRIKNVTTPALFIFSMKDEIVPVQQMLDLYSAATNIPKKQKIVIDNAHHNDTWFVGLEQYFTGLNNFIYKSEG